MEFSVFLPKNHSLISDQNRIGTGHQCVGQTGLAFDRKLLAGSDGA